MTAGLILFVLVMALLLLRQSVILILFFVTGYIHLVYGDGRIDYLIDDIWTSVNREVLLAIPMFIVAGNIMTRGSIATRLVAIMRSATQWLPGGLGVATILSCALFAAISGSSPVTLLAVGSILYPALIQQGYDRKYALGALASGGTLGVLIPPSIPMILYGIVVEHSIIDMFIAGIVPGLLLTVVLTAYSLFANRQMPSIPFDGRDFLSVLRKGILAMMMPVILLGGIYSGYFSATEAAAVSVGYAIIVEVFIHKELGITDLFGVAVDAAKLFGTLFPIIAVALSLNLLLTAEQVPQDLAAWVGGLVENRFMFLILLNIFLLIVGCFIDIVSAILMLAPILLPIAQSYGIDPIHFGIIMVINLEIGFITPPMGLNLIIAMTAFKENFLLICRSVLPFIAMMLLVLILVSWFPWISIGILN
ncbi:MAG: TRAP transporter large permease subunit [Alphaproteobacteria bacterium]|jgi:C4-dicarboxylate transporter DctM subunit